MSDSDEALSSASAELMHRLREIVREEVKLATKEAVDAMRAATRSHSMAVERVNSLTAEVRQVATDVDRLAGWCTVKAMRDDALMLKMDRFFDLVTPKTDPDKTPPEGTPR